MANPLGVRVSLSRRALCDGRLWQRTCYSIYGEATASWCLRPRRQRKVTSSIGSQIDLAGMPNPPATGLLDGGLSRFGRDKEVSQVHSPRTSP
jgi:hypothetical protein